MRISFTCFINYLDDKARRLYVAKRERPYSAKGVRASVPFIGRANRKPPRHVLLWPVKSREEIVGTFRRFEFPHQKAR
jgi:hypothetical protein